MNHIKIMGMFGKNPETNRSQYRVPFQHRLHVLPAVPSTVHLVSFRLCRDDSLLGVLDELVLSGCWHYMSVDDNIVDMTWASKLNLGFLYHLHDATW